MLFHASSLKKNLKIRALCSEVLSHNFPIPLLPTPQHGMKMTLETTQRAVSAACFL